ncbi:Homoprotocatechuate catabolism bifunctional isomerase/decarboxylase [Budvicia aquatica]|uniref:Homoprotocatechuate catabolism bifunctional isomerase/decarboxylase n=1 Tax=Budvicia aquatica TaxID=82979 RepID=A0A484ZW65_9GAMM|nr:Homoprotocatechuate catabolism bifunctional isomerase/decarboxylase [Budvicia aquatica]
MRTIAAELEFKAPEEPLIFIKASNTLTGHRQVSVRPDNVDYMHYESELVWSSVKPPVTLAGKMPWNTSVVIRYVTIMPSVIIWRTTIARICG